MSKLEKDIADLYRMLEPAIVAGHLTWNGQCPEPTEQGEEPKPKRKKTQEQEQA